jgi:hypothetical protein
MPRSHGCERKRDKGHREDQHWMRQIFRGLCPIIAIGGEASSSIRGRPNRKWPSHARWSLRRRWRRVGAGSVPRVGQAFGPGAGSRGLAGLQAVKGAAAPTWIVQALYAKGILRYASLSRSWPVIDRPKSCCSEQRGEGYTDHFPHLHGLPALTRPLRCRRLCLGRGSQGMDEHIKTEKHQTDCSGFIVVASTQSFLDIDYSLLNRSLCKFGILSKDLQQSTRRGIISYSARRPGSRPIRRWWRHCAFDLRRSQAEAVLLHPRQVRTG